MLFNSIDFLFFLPIVFVVYWGVFRNNYQYQNGSIVLASYIFYGWWDVRFLALIVFSSVLDFGIGLKIDQTKNTKIKKRWLWLSLSANLGILGFFKYYNFFIDSFVQGFTFFGISLETTHMQIILPVGISFYTFQTLSYTIDIFRNQLKPTRNIVAFLAFVSFFPQLVAGPIERARHLLPQFHKKRTFNYSESVDGLKQFLWGLFKKVVIADSCAEMADWAFAHADTYSGSSLYLGAIFFAFQIYGDFSGYSDMAIGTAKLFNFRLQQNFTFPYFSRNIAEFWRRWHISLSTWFRDYLYIPLGGSRGNKRSTIRNVCIVFVISGFWHGANWTFIGWGVLHALFFLPLILQQKNRTYLDTVASNSVFPSFKEIVQMLITFNLVTFAWILFRATDIHQAILIYSKILSPTLFETPEYVYIDVLIRCVFLIIIFVIIEWIGRREQYAIEKIVSAYPRYIRWSFYSFIIVLIGVFAKTKESPFIYFQF